MVLECGHTFCSGCFESTLDQSRSSGLDAAPCATCRAEAYEESACPNFTVRDIVGGLTAKCRCPECGSGAGDGAKKRKRDDEGGPSGEDGACGWVGPLDGLGEHRKTCGYQFADCPVEGCRHRCLRKDLDEHLSGSASMVFHMKLIALRYETKLRSQQDELKSLLRDGVHQRCARACREWIDYRPEALSGFKLHAVCAKGRPPNNRMVGLLCYIPGPSNSPWEGAMIPTMMAFSSETWRPPKCSFPGGFFHLNVYPSGTIDVPTLNEENSWDPTMTLPEILFTIQQRLCHPSINSPSQAGAYKFRVDNGKEAYDRRCREEADKYRGASKGAAEKAERMAAQYGAIDPLGVVERAERMARKKTEAARPPPVPDFERDEEGRPRREHWPAGHNDCECSCCAWGQRFWSKDRKMRFIFGM